MRASRPRKSKRDALWPQRAKTWRGMAMVKDKAAASWGIMEDAQEKA
ncbi:hypothetical protein JCM14124_06460 [Humidesulfovibrio idahonensis]